MSTTERVTYVRSEDLLAEPAGDAVPFQGLAQSHVRPGQDPVLALAQGLGPAQQPGDVLGLTEA